MTHEWKASLIALTATELREQLQNGVLTSHQLVEACLAQIKSHNKDGMAPRDMISVLDARKALTEADRLDQERREGSTRGYFHEISIVVKVSNFQEEILPPRLSYHIYTLQDTINTGPELGMPTTLGAPSLLTAEPEGNARVIEEVLVRSF